MAVSQCRELCRRVGPNCTKQRFLVFINYMNQFTGFCYEYYVACLCSKKNGLKVLFGILSLTLVAKHEGLQNFS